MNIIDFTATAILIITLIITGLLVVFVYKHNPHSATNRLFAFLGASIFVWMIILQLSFLQDVLLPTVYWIRLSLCLGALQCGLIFVFSRTIPSEKIQLSNKINIVIMCATVAIMVLTLTPYSFSEVTSYINNIPNPKSDWGLVVFNLFAVITLLASVVINVKKYKMAETAIKSQYLFVLVGIFGMYGLTLLTISLPIIFFQNYLFIKFHYVYAFLLVISFAYAITRHRLFNIRLAIKRWLIKSVIIIFVSAAGLGIIYGTNSATANPTAVYVVTLLVLIAAAVCINYIFDHYLTRSAYDISIPEELELIEDADAALTQLRRDVIKIVRDTYGYETTLFFLYDWREKIYRTYQNDKLVILPADHSVINMMSAGPTILTTEELKQNKTMPVGVRSEILQFMKRHHADIIIPLYTELFTPGIMVAKRIDPESTGIKYKPQLLDFTRKYGHYMERTLTFDALVRNQRTE